MTFLISTLIMYGLIFIILTIPYSPDLLNFSLAQRGNFHFGNQDMENAGGQLGQGNTGGQLGQGNAGGQLGQGNAKSIGGMDCPTGPKGASNVGCSADANHVSSSTDTTNNIVVSGSSSSTGSSSLDGKTYIIHGPTDKTGGNPYSSTASCHNGDLILGGGSIYDISDGNVISYSAIPDSLSTFTTTITTSSSMDSALTVQTYAICYDNP